MVNPLAALSVLVTLQLIVSQYTAHGDPASEVDTSKSKEDGKDSKAVPDGYTAFPDIEVAYRYYEYNYTWDMARKHCASDGGWLAVIDSVEKRVHANSVVPADSPDPFVGIHRLFDQSEWATITFALPMEFVPWDGDSAMNDMTQLCTRLSVTGVTPVSCIKRGSHLCEVEIPTQSQKQLNKTDGQPLLKSIMDIPSGYTVFPDLGVAYKFYNASVTWNEARKYCILNAEFLAVIDSYEKVEPVIRLTRAISYFHVGMHRLFEDGKWIDHRGGSSATAVPWRKRSYDEEASRKCMALSTDGGDDGLFANTCDATGPFVCEVSIYEN